MLSKKKRGGAEFCRLQWYGSKLEIIIIINHNHRSLIIIIPGPER